ncbi:MAG: response regulator transcription factor [Actinomycetota bacterium]|nr:response regulator transcription factor [Actinomycetota bacterium]MDA8342837.1 response regulator transcription factor [Actinomycetota bacterium]
MDSPRRTIVVVEDDPSIASLVELYLDQAGFDAVVAGDGPAGLAAIDRTAPALAVIDLGLPGGLDGLELCRRLRSKGHLPIVILTARGDEVDRVVGLELGADDYIAKPFSPRELVARIRAVLRRSERDPGSPVVPPVLVVGPVRIDTARREVHVGERVVDLTTREFDLLTYFATNAGLALTRRQILEGVWGPEWFGDERTIDVHVRQLRAKLGAGLPLATMRGVGYRLA